MAGASLVPMFLFLMAFLLVPYLILLQLAFKQYSAFSLYNDVWTLDNVAAVVTDPFYLRLMGRTVWLGVLVTAFTLLIGYPVSLLIVRSRRRMKTILMALVLSPMLVNLVVRSYIWLILLGDRGFINSWLMNWGIISEPLPISANLFAVTIALVQITLPLMVLSLIAIMETIDRSLIEAAESAGADDKRIFWRIWVPLSMPGISSGSLLVFCYVISAFVTPALIGSGRVSTASTVIYEKFTYAVNWPMGAALVMALLVVNAAVLALHTRFFRNR